MLKQIVLVGVITAFGIGGIATPSFASTGVSADFCDSAVPGNCNTFTVQAASVSGSELTAAWYGDCTGNGPSIPTLDVQCVYLEVDYPVVP